MIENKRKVFLGVVGVATLVILILGASFAYFSASLTGSNNVNALSYKFDVTLDVNLVNPSIEPSKGYGLIPLDEENISTAITNNCIDSKGYAACRIYELTFTNNSGQAVTLNGTLTPTGNIFDNLKYIVTAVGGQKSSLSTGTPVPVFDLPLIAGFRNLTIPTGTSKMYVMLYVKNISGNQPNDQGKTFAGTLTFVDTTGGNQLYAKFSSGEECEDCIYTIDDSWSIYTNQALPNNITTYQTLSALEQAEGPRSAWLKLKIKNNTVTDAWVEFRYNGTIHSLKGGDGGTSYSNNVGTLTQAFDISVCSQAYICTLPNFEVGIGVNGGAYATNYEDTECHIDDDGAAYCVW